MQPGQAVLSRLGRLGLRQWVPSRHIMDPSLITDSIKTTLNGLGCRESALEGGVLSHCSEGSPVLDFLSCEFHVLF